MLQVAEVAVVTPTRDCVATSPSRGRWKISTPQATPGKSAVVFSDADLAGALESAAGV
jgi:hypothetical protein